MSRNIILFLLIATEMFAQNEIDSLFLFNNNDHHHSILQNINNSLKDGPEKLPLQNLILKTKTNISSQDLRASDKILYTEITENYKFTKEELNSGLSDTELISYLKNKRMTLKILADDYYNHTDVNWGKIERILGVSKNIAAFLVAFLSLM